VSDYKTCNIMLL